MTQTQPTNEWMTIEEVAAELRRPPSTVRYWRHMGTGPQGVRFGRRLLFRRSEVDRWIRTQEASAAHK